MVEKGYNQNVLSLSKSDISFLLQKKVYYSWKRHFWKTSSCISSNKSNRRLKLKGKSIMVQA